MDALAAGGGFGAAYVAVELAKYAIRARNGKKDDPCDRCRMETHDTHQIVHGLKTDFDKLVEKILEKLDKINEAQNETNFILKRNGGR